MSDSRSCLALDDLDMFLLRALLFSEVRRLRERQMEATADLAEKILARVDAALERRESERRSA